MKITAHTLTVAIFVAMTVTTLAEVKIEEKTVGPAFTPGIVYTLSPKGMHVATAHGRDGKTLVTVDGVDGPLMDNIFPGAAGDTVVKVSEDGYYTRVPQKWTGPVEFSPNGERHAYPGQLGKDTVVFLDGKEVFRGTNAVDNLQFSPDSQHLFFLERTTDSYQSYRLIRDGQPVTPAFEPATMPVFSADGSRWALSAGKPRQWTVKQLIVDGKDPGYVGEQPQFTPDGKHLVCVAGQTPKYSVLVDGKEMVSNPGFVKFVISPTGDIGAIMVPGNDGRRKLFLNGKPVVDDASDVVFSPDGKRWAAHCGLNQKSWIILNDGTRHKEYGPIMNVTFTPDSSKLVYVASIGDTTYVVTDGKEDEGNKLVHYRPVFAQTGNAFFYIAGFQMGQLRVHYNDHIEPECLANNNVTLSPDGKRWVYYSKRKDNTTRFIENGVETGPSAMVQGGPVLFSPDSKHMVAPLFQAYWCDGQRIVPAATPVSFTPDSQHLILKGKASTPEGAMLNTFFVNGDLVAKFSARGSTWAGYSNQKGWWEQQPDGTIVFVGWDVGMVGGHGPIKRITVTPDPARNYVAWLADLKTGEAKAVADAEAAKKKAEEDAAAAAAKRKADYEAALAAKKKAYADAVAAKQLKLLNAQRAKQGFPPLTELPAK